MRFTLNYFTKRQPFLTPTIPEKFVSLLRDRINRSVLSLSVSTENTSALFSRGSSESKRRTLLVFIPFNITTNRPMGNYEPFVDGFIIMPNGCDTFCVPVCLLVLKDGSLIFTDEGNRRIYQVQYKNSAHRYNLAS